jgi:hypothetical protein
MVVDDPSRALNPAFTNDGVHPVAAGYEVMEPLLVQAIETALGAPCCSGIAVCSQKKCSHSAIPPASLR